MKTPPIHSTHRQQQGVTLIEVLITMVVMAIGLLGFAALQTVSMKSNGTALYRSYATMAAYDIIDSMRVNRAAARAGNYDRDFGDAAPTSPTTIADQDVKSWLDALAENLPKGDGKIAVNGGAVNVEIQWSEGTKNDLTTIYKSFSTESSLRP